MPSPLSLGLVRTLSDYEATRAGAGALEPEHFWLALCKVSALDPRTVVEGDPVLLEEFRAEVRELTEWFKANSLDPGELRSALRKELGQGPGRPKSLHRSAGSMAAYREASRRAKAAGKADLSLSLLASSIFDSPPPPLWKLLVARGHPERKPAVQGPAPGPSPAAQPASKEMLLLYGRDLTQAAREGRLPPVVGRHEEIRRLAQTLQRRHKPNAVLIGEAGVGKTAIVEGLALKCAAENAVAALRGKQIFDVSVTSLVSGASKYGEVEQRFQAILKEAAEDRNVILFFDEIHTLLGANRHGVDPSNIIKPALARGEVQVIGATTTQEYERIFAQDPALERRFERIRVEEPSRADALVILAGIASDLERHHGVRISEDATVAAVDLAIRFMPDRRLPDKALDVLDQACAQRAVFTITPGDGPNGQAGPGAPGRIERADVVRVVAQLARVPVDIVDEDDSGRARRLEAALGARILGQGLAVREVGAAIRAAFSPLRDPSRPIVSFLFCGPTGVGKTETAKILAEVLFGGTEALVQIDLSEYSEKHQIARLIGSPPGYVRSDEPGLLTAALIRRPASVVLFDEVEKAHPDVLNVLLQILDEGRLTDGHGRIASFRESLVVLTTNLVAGSVGAGARRGIGFGETIGPRMAGGSEMDLESIRAALTKHLRPELLGRIRHLVRFSPLDRAAVEAITAKLFDDLIRRLRDRGVLDVPPKESFCRELLREMPDAAFGAREIQAHLEARIATWFESGGAIRGRPGKMRESADA